MKTAFTVVCAIDAKTRKDGKLMWWETEEPNVMRTKKNVLRWYPNAGKLQVSRPDWVDENGEVRTGKTVTVDARDQQQEVKTFFQEIIGSMEGMHEFKKEG